MEAVAEVTSSRGYVAMSVEDICQAASLSRRTFYEQFANKEEAFLAAYDAIATQALTQVGEAYNGADVLVDRIRFALAAFLNFLTSHPAFASMCIVEVLAAGQQALERRATAMRGFTEFIVRAVEEGLPESRRPPELVAETIVGGIYEVIYARVQRGRTAELPDLLPELLYAILVPYLGADIARRELQKIQG